MGGGNGSSAIPSQELGVCFLEKKEKRKKAAHLGEKKLHDWSFWEGNLWPWLVKEKGKEVPSSSKGVLLKRRGGGKDPTDITLLEKRERIGRNLWGKKGGKKKASRCWGENRVPFMNPKKK